MSSNESPKIDNQLKMFRINSFESNPLKESLKSPVKNDLKSPVKSDLKSPAKSPMKRKVSK